jgi:DNA-binding transcriptional regulator YhcF (GntR family)
MSWNLSDSSPIYLQLIHQIELRILSGQYASGEHFPSVRDLAAEAAVNPNTMQKALAYLEQEGLLVGNRTSGRTVTTDQSMLCSMREKTANQLFEEFHRSLSDLGFSEEEIKEFIMQKYR